MYEVEVKVAADHEEVRGHLPADATSLGTVEQVDTYFDAPHRDFAETDEALRLRRERGIGGGPTAERNAGTDATGGSDSDCDAAAVDDRGGDPDADGRTTAVTYKGPLLEAESKSREEFETLVGDGDVLEAALERLGFEPAAEVRKERERYAVGEFTVSLDAVAGLGEFLEVETERESDDIDAARDGARDVIEALGGDPEEQIRTSYLGLLLAGE